MSHRHTELLAIGAGPSNLALAVALEEGGDHGLAHDCLLIEQQEEVVWQRGMLLPWAQSQVSFLKDLVTLRNPRSRFSFVNYLHSVGRLNDFINLGSFTPYRLEISGYLQWVARSLERVRIEYGRPCERIDPVRNAAGAITGWLVHLRGGSTIQCRHLVLGTGRDARVPEVFAGIPREHLIHSTEFAGRIGRFDDRPPSRIVVLGGAQSAAEMLWAAQERFPQADCTMVMRSIGLSAYDSSRFTNELFFPSAVGEFYDALPQARTQILDEMHRSNYAGLSPAMLDSLYRRIYVQKLTGEPRLHMRTMSDVVRTRYEGRQVVLTVADRRTGLTEELPADLVLLGTGFTAEMPALVRELAATAGLDEIEVSRTYRVRHGSCEHPGAAQLYLQGVNEATHGISDSLLSILAVRAGEIADEITGHHRAQRLGSAESATTAAA
ncbi:SidA/IucD/PvdA family monooxygenase [Streptomyces lincolnensis]|uniref:SidA/IucD/PvdA family monooxygenase n=1 Tax=Streptomyces lincolnensis TaxID=1915 RepID=UPI0037D24690